jgi:hypothetical protein
LPNAASAVVAMVGVASAAAVHRFRVTAGAIAAEAVVEVAIVGNRFRVTAGAIGVDVHSPAVSVPAAAVLAALIQQARIALRSGHKGVRAPSKADNIRGGVNRVMPDVLNNNRFIEAPKHNSSIGNRLKIRILIHNSIAARASQRATLIGHGRVEEISSTAIKSTQTLARNFARMTAMVAAGPVLIGLTNSSGIAIDLPIVVKTHGIRIGITGTAVGTTGAATGKMIGGGAAMTFAETGGGDSLAPLYRSDTVGGRIIMDRVGRFTVPGGFLDGETNLITGGVIRLLRV